MQGFLSEKENTFSTIALDFKKKDKSKPSSQRNTSNSSLIKTQNGKMVSANTISLLQKKKQYAQSIREQNVQKQGKKSRRQGILQEKICNQIENFNADVLKMTNSNLTNVKGYSTNRTQKQSSLKKSAKSFLYQPLASKSNDQVKIKKQNKKMQHISLIEGIKDHDFNQNFSIISISNNYATDQPITNQQLSVIEKLHDLSRIERVYQLCSRQVDESICPFETDQKKQTQLIKKQNNTFKKELASFRKENTSLKRQIEQLKKQVALFQSRNDFLQNQSSEQLNMLSLLQTQANQSIATLSQLQIKKQLRVSHNQSQLNDKNTQETINYYENELFQATSLNKRLQFKNYMLQKKLMEQAQIHKKQMVKEISVWKQRYIKARNQNLKLKDSRCQMLFDMSIIQQI